MENDSTSEAFDVQKEIQQIDDAVQNNNPELLENINEADSRNLIGMVAEAWKENENEADLNDAVNSTEALLKVINRQYVRKTDITSRRIFAGSAARFMSSRLADQKDENGFSHRGTLRPMLKDLDFKVVEPTDDNGSFQVLDRG